MHDKELEEKILSLFNDEKTKKEGFTLLVNHFKKSIYFQIRRIVITHENTDDVVQEVFIKCWNKLNTFNGKSKLSTWIYRVTYNEAIQWIRKNRKEYHLNISEIQTDNQPTINIFHKDADEISILLEKAILQLPEKQKMVFQLKYFEDLSYKEIQIIIGGSIGGLKANYHHAVTKIEKLLSSD
ncbi:MAG: sigma-70 family RNA polymerase sigma factor [Flavobacteriales bacterium]